MIQKCLRRFGKHSVPVVALTSLAAPAYAYLDPGTGSMIVQMLIAGIVGALFAIKMYWYRLKRFCARLFGAAEPEIRDDGAIDTTMPESDRGRSDQGNS